MRKVTGLGSKVIKFFLMLSQRLQSKHNRCHGVRRDMPSSVGWGKDLLSSVGRGRGHKFKLKLCYLGHIIYLSDSCLWMRLGYGVSVRP